MKHQTFCTPYIHESGSLQLILVTCELGAGVGGVFQRLPRGGAEPSVPASTARGWESGCEEA